MADVFKNPKNDSGNLHKIDKNGGQTGGAGAAAPPAARGGGRRHFRGKYHGRGDGGGQNCEKVKIALDESGFFL